MVVAIIGCVTGVCSLVLSFYKILCDKPKLKVELPLPHLNGFTLNKDPYFKSDVILVATFRIINVGLVPVSIKNLRIAFDGIVCAAITDYKLSVLIFETAAGKSLHYPMKSPKVTPFILSPGEIVETTYVFPFADDLHKVFTEKHLETLDAHIFTSTSKIRVLLPVMDLSFDNIRNYQVQHRNELERL